MGGFGDEMPSLLLTREWLGYGGYDLADRVIYLMLRCLDYLKDWDMEDMIWLDIDIDIETKNWYFKFDFINIADDNIIIISICLKSSIVSNQ